MQDQIAQVTSSLLQFPEVTVQALGEDEITLDSVLRGKFAAGRNGLAWLACGPQLEVVNSVTGERLSAYRFSGVTEQPPTVLAVKEFSWQKRTGLLVGIEETEGSVLCLYDLGISRVVKAVILPGRVTAIEPIINHGGATASTQHLHQSLRWFFGVAAVVTDVGHVLLVDLCLDDLSCSHDELEAYDLEVMSGIPAEIPQIREDVTRQRRHLCLQLLNPSGTTVTTLCYIGRTNQLAVGFSDGYLSLWNMKTLKREYHCILEGGRVPIYAVAFQEPENDPRNCCYLWAVQSTQESEGDLVSLHLLQLAFGDRKCLASGQILYEGLEYCEERYSLDLTGGVFSLRNQTSNTRLLGCQTVERFRSHGERDDSLNDAVSPDTSVSVFSWQVNVYGQGKPSTYLAVFDINRWYHAQMPDSLRPGEFLHNCSYFTLWSLDAVVSMTSPHYILDILVHERSLSRGVPPSYPPPEQFFSPSTYNFDATCLVNSGVVHVAFTGLQKETLHFLKKSGPFLSEAVPDGYNRCLVSGLLSPRLADVQPSSMSQEEQLQAVLSAAVGTSSLGLLTGCIKQWTAEEQPRSAANLRFILEWTWNKVTTTKEELDRLCASLFDGSCNFIDLQTLQSLQHCQLLLGNLCSVLNCFLTEAHELTKKGFIDLTNKKVVTCLIFQYAQVVLWFCRSGLLPEGSDMAADMQLSRPTYNYHSLHNYYVGRRQKLERLSRGKWNFDCLMIDGMLAQFGDHIGKLWSRDEGGTGKYPPANLHALLDIYLLENVEDTMKHAITIYLLLDIMYSIPNKTGTAVESFPTAFAMPWGLVKLVQGFWLLDHNDHKNSLDAILHPATSRTMLTWHHTRIIQSLMCQGEHRQALRYIQMMKPPMTSSSEVTLHLTVLLCNRSIVEALNLLRLHSNKLNVKDLLRHMYETCQEMGLMEDLLKLPFTDTEQECLENFLQTSGVKNQEFLLVHHLQRANYISALQLNQSLKVNLMNDREPRFRERTDARNSILDQYGKVLPRVQMRLAAERTKPYSLPSSVLREVSRPRPLSTVVKQIAKGNIVSKATFINNVLTKIREVSSANEQEADFSIYKSLNNDESMILPDAFVGTPITKASQRISRLLNSVVHPVPQFSPELASYRQTPVKANSLQITSSPLQSNIRKSGPIKNILKATEFGLLETPLIVRRAKVLATCGDTSGFAVFTPQSILRSSLRTTPLGSPCQSPGRSVTPPLRSKETKISFMEENVGAKWTGVTVGDCKTKLLLLDSPVQKSLNVTRSAWTNCTEKVSSFASGSQMGLHLEVDECSVTAIENNLSKMEASKETSNVSARSDQTTLEYHDAHDTEDFEDVAFVASNAPDPVSDKPTKCHNWQGQDEMAENEQLEYQQKDDLQLNVSQLQYSQCHEEDLESDAEEHPELQEQENFEEIVGDEQLEFQEQKSLSDKDPSVSQIVEHSPCHVEDSETATEEPSKLQLQLEKYDEMAENEQLEFQQQKMFPLDHNVSQIVQIPQGRFDDLWSIPTEEPSILQMQEEKDKEMAENEQLEIEQKTFLPLEVHNELQEREVEYLIVPENGVALLDDISTEQDICAPAYLLPDIDGESFDRESEEKALSVKSSTYTSESTVADAESVISIHDSEDFASIYSENRLEEGNHEDPVEDHTIDAKVIEKRGLEKETIPPTTLQSDSRNSVETQEIHVFEKDGSLEIQLEETGVISYGEFNSPGTGKVPCVFESIEEHFTSELDDGKDTAECEMIETDGEHFVAQNNFSLVLEGEEEAEKELAILATPEKAGSTTKNYVEYDEQDDIRNTLSFVASANEPNVIEALPSVAETNIELLAYVSEQSTLEARTYISESIKESVTENVQNIYKDRSKDIALEVMEQSVCETEPQTGTNITSCNSSRTPLKTVVGSNEKDVHFGPVDDWLTSVKHSGAQSIKDLSIHSTEVEQLSPKEYKQELVALSTQKRSSRRTKDLSLDSDEISTDKQASQILTPRRRGSRKDKVSTTEASENRHSLIALEQEASVLRSGLRRAKSTVSDRPEVLNIENLPLKNIKMLSTPKRITRSITNLTEEQESSQLVSDQKLQMPVTPRRNAKISKAVLVELSEHIPSKPENEHSDHEQQLPLVLTKGAKGDGSSASEGFESLGSDSSKLMSHQEVLELPSTPRRSSRKSILSVSEVADTSHKSPIDERQPKEKEQIPQTQKITKRIKTGKTDIHNDVKNTSKQTLEEPSEAIDNQNNSVTRTINLNESHLHSVTEESTEVKSSPHVAREERLDTAGLALTDAPSSDEKLQNARKSNIFRDEELASNERMQESTEVLQTERDSIGVATEHESLSRKTQQPSSVEKEKTVFPSILQSSSEERESNPLVGPHVPIASDHKMLSKKLKNEVDLSGNMGSNRQLPSEQPHAIPVTPKRGARGRNKSVVEHSEPAELNVSTSLITPAKHQFPLTPRRSSRRGTSNLLDVMDSNPQEGSGLKEQDKMLNSSSRRPKRGKTSQTSNEEEGVRHTSEGTSEDSSSELVSRRTPRGRKKENIDNRSRKSQLPSVSEESTVEERLPSPETRERLHGADSVLTRSLRLHGKKTNRDTEGTSKSSSEEETRVDSSKELNNKQKHGSRMTKIHDKQKRKGQPASVAEESTDEKSSETPESKERLQGKDSVLTVAPRLHRKEETVVEHNSTRTRSSNLSVPPYVTVDVNEHFVFSPPSTKRKNQKAGKTRHPELLFNLESDVSAQFVYSPPAMRTRRKDQSSISEIVKERDLLIQENTQTTEEPIVKKRGRPSKPKTKDSRSSKVPWSPPPVEAKLISPFPSPAIEATSNTKTSSDEATEKMTLRRNRKRLLSTFTKPVTRRKMR